MRLSLAVSMSLALAALCPTTAQAQKKEALIVFKDGFFISGRVVEKRELFFDPASGAAVSIPKSGGLITLDDYVRRIYFIPGQLQEVLEQKNPANKDLMEFRRPSGNFAPKFIFPDWTLESHTPWNNKWERNLKFYIARKDGVTGYQDMTQRIVAFTPHHIYIQTLHFKWDMFYLTKEYGLQEVRSLLFKYLADKKEFKDLKEFDKRHLVAKFLGQVGWHEAAEKELENLGSDYPNELAAIAPLKEKLKKIRADQFVEGIERAFKNGQHKEAQESLAKYATDGMAPLVSPKNQLTATDLKNKYDELNEKLTQAKSLLKDLPTRLGRVNQPFWKGAVEPILAELNHDTLNRLDSFIVFAQQHVRELEEKKKPTQTSEEVLALAVTGWLLGNGAAEPDVKNARQLFKARKLVLDYQKNDQQLLRAQTVASFTREYALPLDVLARLIRQLPPPFPLDQDQISTDIQKLEIEVPDSNGGKYFLQLPPGYNHNRPSPVLLYLHGGKEKVENMLERHYSGLAAQHGYILAAPIWGRGLQPTYGFSEREHGIVSDCLRDLRRRLQVDSDRVFLAGYEQGADAALDIGLGHPDQFAGILPMCVNPRYFPDKCWSNAQYLPVYMVDADRQGTTSKAISDLFKNWVRGSYPALYIEYKGRGVEFFGAELPTMFDWMNRKKRFFPGRELGRWSNTAAGGEEFKTMRTCDNRFYWLSTDAIGDGHLNSSAGWDRNIIPATLQGNVSVGNESKGKKDANVWTQFNIRTRGVKQVSLWISPSAHDFTRPARIILNGTQIGGTRLIPPSAAVLLEDFYHSGDRQRLFFARVDLKP